MKRRHLLLGVAAVAAGAAAKYINWEWRENNHNERRSLLIGGASAMYDVNKALAMEFAKNKPLLNIVVDRGGSLQGLIAVKRGAIDLAAMTRDLTNDEDSVAMHNFLVARGNITIIVNKLSPIKNLTQAQVKAIFKGDVTNWKSLGGSDAPINVISREYGSSTRQYVEDVLLEGAEFTSNIKELSTTRLVANAVATDPFAVGYIASKDSAGIVDVNAVDIDNITASRISILSGRYPFTHSFYLLMSGELTGTAFDFIRFVRSRVGQQIIEQHGLISVC
jgi:phosphate transport system substrate-binding protein